MTLRLAFVLLLAAGASACGGESDDVPDGMGWLVEADADTTDASDLLGLFASGAVGDAFERLNAQPYRVTATIADLEPVAIGSRLSSDEPFGGDTLGVFEQTLEVRPGAPATRTTAAGREIVVVSTRAVGTLSDTSALDLGRLLPSDPFPSVLPDDPPFLDPRTRGAYRLSSITSRAGRQLSAEVADGTADRPLVRRAGVTERADGGLDLGAYRASASAIYDEETVVGVQLSPGERVPESVAIQTQVTTPGRRRVLVTAWAITPLGAPPPAQDPTINSREP